MKFMNRLRINALFNNKIIQYTKHHADDITEGVRAESRAIPVMC